VSKKKPIIFSTTDVWGNLISLSSKTWNTHITLDHPEMASLQSLIQQVVQDPFEVRESTNFSTSVAFISEPGAGSHTEGIRVLVDYADTHYQKGASSGNVTTAYPIDTIKYSAPQLGKSIYKKGGSN
jgi:hypothetical protein